ncbi:MAG: ABC transporter ATP-binding protein [Bacteroidales bacterium]|nr:ABC transporter ATP-binding protein [Bacteroidales bacterium]
MKGLGAMVRPLSGRIIVTVLIGLVRIGASLLFVWICKKLIDIASGVDAVPIGPYVWTMIGVMALQLASNVAFNYWQGLTEVKTRLQMRRDLFAHIIRSSWNGRETFHSADAINRMQEDLRVVVDLICSRLPDAVVTLCQLIAASIFLLHLAPKLVWLLLLLMVVAVLGSKMFFRLLRELTEKIRKKDSEVQGHIQENLQRRVLVLTLFGVDRVTDRMEHLQDDIRNNAVKRLNYNAVARTFMSMGFMSGYAAAFLWGVFGIKSGTVTFGMMTAFLQLVGQIQRPIADLSRHIPAFINSLTSVERLMELQELPLEPEVADDAFPEAPGVRVDSLSFAYPDDGKTVIDGLDFDFKPGTTTVITGHTGAGKSTLVRLVMALLTPVKGRIELYDSSRSVPSSVATRCNFTYVPQGNSLMSGTIRENLLLADAAATDEQMREALHIAAADFVQDLPAGLDTLCSEVGAGLSEGQAQRVAIARALLRPGRILILDEASSSLDAATEQILLDRLASACKGEKTILFISHREAVSRYADAQLSF